MGCQVFARPIDGLQVCLQRYPGSAVSLFLGIERKPHERELEGRAPQKQGSPQSWSSWSLPTQHCHSMAACAQPRWNAWWPLRHRGARARGWPYCSMLHCSNYTQATAITSLSEMCLMPDAMSSALALRWQPHHYDRSGNSNLQTEKLGNTKTAPFAFQLTFCSELSQDSRSGCSLCTQLSHLPAPEATMREVISIHIGQAGIQVRVAALLSRPHLLPLFTAPDLCCRSEMPAGSCTGEPTELPS